MFFLRFFPVVGALLLFDVCCSWFGVVLCLLLVIVLRCCSLFVVVRCCLSVVVVVSCPVLFICRWLWFGVVYRCSVFVACCLVFVI